MNILRTCMGIGLLTCVAACGQPEDSRSQPPLPALDTFTVTASGSAAARAWDGVVEAVRQADLSAQTSGRIASVLADVNDRVEAGSVLLRLTDVEQQAGSNTARAQLRAAQANAVEAQANYQRVTALEAKQYVSRLQLDQVRAARDAALAERDAARARLDQAAQQTDYTVVRAPFAGIVSARAVEPGESVAPGQPLMSLYAPDALRIEVQVPQSDADAIRLANRARVLLTDGRDVAAAAVIVFPAADPATHSVTVRITLPELTDPPQPGVTARIAFPIGDAAGLLQIPASAVIQRGELSGVYVVEDQRLTLRQLRIGHRVGDRVEVLAGLKADETIARDPIAALQALATQRQAARDDHE